MEIVINHVVLIAIVLLGLVQSLRHPYGPHEIQSKLMSTWFEGWYSRILTEDGESWGIIFGSHQSSKATVKDNYTPSLVSILYQRQNKSTLISKDFSIDSMDIKSGECDICFTVLAKGRDIFASMIVNSTMVSYQLEIENKRIDIQLDNHTPWSKNSQLGPEGIVTRFGPLLPLHWYVLSVKSNARLQQTDFETNEITVKTGWAHLEKNWGNAFPKQWIWAQASNQNAQVVLAGGQLPLPLIGSRLKWVKAYLLKIRLNDSNIDINWYPQDALLHPLKVTVNTKQYEVQLSGRKSGYDIQMIISGERDSFARVKCPTEKGFADYSIESYSAKMRLRIIRSSQILTNQDDNERGDVLDAEISLDNAALEFGGEEFA